MRLEARHRGASWLRVFILLGVLASVLGVGANRAAAQNPDRSNAPINLSDAEQAWIRQHPRIRVHNETNWPPFNFAEGGQPQGYSIDFMTLLARRVGLQVEYVTGPSWDEFLAMMKRGELDVMLNIVRTPERQEYLAFTQPYARNPNTIVSRNNAPYRSLTQLVDKTVAVPKGFFYEEVLGRDYPQIKVLPVADAAASLQAVAQGDADAALGELAVLNYLSGRLKMDGLTLSGELALGDPELALARIATRLNEPLLASILHKAIDALPGEQRRALEDKWLGRDQTFAVPWVRSELSDAEIGWLSQHQEIRLGVNPSYPPFDFVDATGVFSGMSADYVELIVKRLGVKTTVVPGLSWNEVLASAKDRRVDVTVGVKNTPDRQSFLNFTRDYLTFPLVIMTRDTHPMIAGLADLRGRT